MEYIYLNLSKELNCVLILDDTSTNFVFFSNGIQTKYISVQRESCVISELCKNHKVLREDINSNFPM
jgi:hypothetical protein